MTTINTYDLTTLQLFKRLANFATKQNFDNKDLLSAYGRVKRHLFTQDKSSEDLKQPLNALINFKDFMVESYQQREERERLFREHLSDLVIRTFEELKGTKYRLNYTLA